MLSFITRADRGFSLGRINLVMQCRVWTDGGSLMQESLLLRWLGVDSPASRRIQWAGHRKPGVISSRPDSGARSCTMRCTPLRHI